MYAFVYVCVCLVDCWMLCLGYKSLAMRLDGCPELFIQILFVGNAFREYSSNLF